MNNDKLSSIKNLINNHMNLINVDNYNCIVNINQSTTIKNINGIYESFVEQEEEIIKFQVFMHNKQYIFSQTGLKNLDKVIENIPNIIKNLEVSEFYDNKPIFHEKVIFEKNFQNISYEIPNKFIDELLLHLNNNMNNYSSEIWLSFTDTTSLIFNKANYEHLRQTKYGYFYLSITEDFQNDKYTDYDYKIFFKSHEPKDIINEIKDNLSKMKLKTKIPINKYRIIVTKNNSDNFINMIIKGLHGNLLWLEKSFLLGKIGEKIFANNINIIENPQIDNSLNNSSVDMEGNVINKKYLVKNGIVKSMLLNKEYADKFKTVSTGNGWNFGIGYTNIYLESGDTTFNDLIKEMNTGIIIHSIIGAGFQVHNGEISVSILGFYYENGDFKGSVTGTLSGNIIDALSNVIICNDLNINESISPSLLLNEMTFCQVSDN